MDFDTLITNGTVVDGTGGPRKRADVGVAGGRIAAVGDLAGQEAALRIDASGSVVVPGFIDAHSHSDVCMLEDPGGESKVHQGVTTEVTGNCAYSPFPSGDAGPDVLQRALGSIMRGTVEWDWTTLDEWADRVESSGVSINIAPLVGHHALRISVGAVDDRPPTPDELSGMRRLAAEAVEQGAFGMTTGLTYSPSCYSEVGEIAAIADAIKGYDGAFHASHTRVWAGWHFKAMEELLEVGRRTGIGVHYSHLAIIDSRHHGRADELMGILDRARDEGIDATADVYPYTAAGTGLSALIPDWASEGGVEGLLRRLRQPDVRGRIRSEMDGGWFRGLPWVWESLVLSHVETDANRGLVGLSLGKVAELRAADPGDTLLDLIDEEDNHVGVVAHNRTEDDMRVFLAHPQSMIGSDGKAISPTGAWADDKPHPRFYGTYPRILGRYVRDEPVISLESAIYKMSGFPAARIGLRDRGRIEEGLAADLVVFDPATVIDRATFEDPQNLAEGVSHVLVGGEAVVSDGVHTGARPGRVLRRGG